MSDADRLSSCSGKVVFDSYRMAVKVFLKRKNKTQRDGNGKSTIYLCNHCKKFHIGGTFDRRP